MITLSKYRTKLRRRERVVQIVNERGYNHIVSQIIIDNHRGYYPDHDAKFLDALREEFE